MSGPSVATIKRLFAVSSNQCAFPKCQVTLVEVESGKVTGKICHIEGVRGPRHNPSQSSDELHAHNNLLLLCPIHHDVVDADPESYSVARLQRMKHEHESRASESLPLSDTASEAFMRGALNVVQSGSVFSSVNQSGGQIANQITNIHSTHVADPASTAKIYRAHGQRAESVSDIWNHMVVAVDATFDASVNLAPLAGKVRRHCEDILVGTPFPELAHGAELTEWQAVQNEYLHIMAFPHFGQEAAASLADLGRSLANAKLFISHQISVAVRSMSAAMQNIVEMAAETKGSLEKWHPVRSATREMERALVKFEQLLQNELAGTGG